MKIQISKEELATMLQSTYNIDLTSGNYEITIEGYIPAVSNRLKAMAVNPNALQQVVKTDKNLNVLDISYTDPKLKDGRKTVSCKNLKCEKVDFTHYNEIVLDFATSSKNQQQLELEDGITIDCLKARYVKAIKLTDTGDLVTFSFKKRIPYLKRR